MGSRFNGRNVPWTRTTGAAADFQVQIASLELHQRPEKLVDFQFLCFAEKALTCTGAVGRQGQGLRVRVSRVRGA